MPALAGTARMPYPKFLAYNAAGGIAWGTVVVLLGYPAGASYAGLEHTLGTTSALIVAVIALGALLTWRIRRHRSAQPAQDRATH